MTNQEEIELRSKIEALGLEVTKVPSKSTPQLDEVYSGSLDATQVKRIRFSVPPVLFGDKVFVLRGDMLILCVFYFVLIYICLLAGDS